MRLPLEQGDACLPPRDDPPGRRTLGSLVHPINELISLVHAINELRQARPPRTRLLIILSSYVPLGRHRLRSGVPSGRVSLGKLVPSLANESQIVL